MKKKQWRPFEEARKFTHSLNLKSIEEYRAFSRVAQLNSKKPDDIPSSPNVVYKGKGWTNWPDYLGHGIVAPQNRRYATYKAKVFERRKGLIEADAATFQVFKGFGNIAKDKDGFFSFGERISEEDLKNEMGEELFKELIE